MGVKGVDWHRKNCLAVVMSSHVKSSTKITGINPETKGTMTFEEALSFIGVNEEVYA